MNILRVEASLKWMVKKNKGAGCGRVQLVVAIDEAQHLYPDNRFSHIQPDRHPAEI